MTIREVSPDWKSEYPDPKSTDKNLGLTNGGIKNGDLAQMMCLPHRHEAQVQSPECMKRKKVTMVQACYPSGGRHRQVEIGTH